jgi:fatty-acyl-CoA synthase
MTETTPIAAVSRPRRRHRDASEGELLDTRLKTGTIVPGLEARICDPETGADLPWDGESVGELECRGPWVASDYWSRNGEIAVEKFHDGWLKTGDVATVDPDGYIRLVDRTKDVVKSGGEWISSVELEGACLAHPAVREAAVVGIPSKKWDERPVVVVSVHDGQTVTLEEMRAFLTDRVAKWWLPDDVVVVDEVAKTSVGKYDKKAIRAQLAGRTLP